MLKLLLEAATWDLLPAEAAPEPAPAEPSPARAGARARAARRTGHRPGRRAAARAARRRGRARPRRTRTSPCSACSPAGPRPSPRTRAAAPAAAAWSPASPWRSPCSLRPAWSPRSPATTTTRRAPTRAGSPAAPRSSSPSTRRSPTRSPTTPSVANRYPIVRVRKTVKLLDSPGGQVQGEGRRPGPSSSRRACSRSSSAGANGSRCSCRSSTTGEIAWMHQDKVSESGTVAWSMHVDLSKRHLVRPQGRRGHAQGADRDRPPRPRDAQGALRGDRQAEGLRPELSLRLLRARAHRPPDQAAAGLARRRPPRGARHARTSPASASR